MVQYGLWVLVSDGTTNRWTGDTLGLLLIGHSCKRKRGVESRRTESSTLPTDQTRITTVTTKLATQAEETSWRMSLAQQPTTIGSHMAFTSFIARWECTFQLGDKVFSTIHLSVPGGMVSREKSLIALGRPCYSLMIWSTMLVVRMMTLFPS